MPLVIEYLADGDGAIVAAPVILCDVCGARIVRAQEGWYLWDAPEHGPGARAPLVFAHKGTADRQSCIDRLEAQHPGRWLSSGELREFPTYLARNLGLTKVPLGTLSGLRSA